MSTNSAPGELAPLRRSGLLDVGEGHRIYWEDSGNPEGIPAVFLHGGPGGSLSPGSYRAGFDPARFRIIGLDQRGCGRSRPLATAPGYDLRDNTTQHLIADVELLREHLGVERWLVTGFSWGVTLAIAYAQAHRQRVLGMTLAAVTTTDRFYVDWITEKVSAIYPEAWDRLAAHAERALTTYRRGTGRLVEAYARLMTDPNPEIREAAAREWVEWEYHHVSIGSHGIQRHAEWDDDPEARQILATLVTHYWAHDGFLDPPITDRSGMERLRDIPGTLIHGRLDVSGPPVLAWSLHRSWPGSELVIEEEEGHGGAAIIGAWMSANDRHADHLTSPALDLGGRA